MLSLPSKCGDLLLTALSFGDVSRNFRCTYDLTFGTSDWRHRQRKYDQAPILALANRFIMFDALSPPDTLEDCKLFIMAVGLGSGDLTGLRVRLELTDAWAHEKIGSCWSGRTVTGEEIGGTIRPFPNAASRRPGPLRNR
jgi:hypothetical protein